MSIIPNQHSGNWVLWKDQQMRRYVHNLFDSFHFQIISLEYLILGKQSGNG